MKCAFCDQESVERGGEHLWDDWLNEERLKKTRFNARKRISGTSTPIEFVTVGLKEKVPAVCQDCNQGWMSALTARMKELCMGAVLDGSPFSLGSREAALLAAFTFMKAAVKAYRYGQNPFFTRAAREGLRTSLEIPPLMKLWFASYHGTSRYSFRSSFDLIVPYGPPLYGIEFFSYTYVVGKLALQVLAPRWKDVRDTGRPLLTITPNSVWEPAVVQFWPYPGRVLGWPPAEYLDDSMVQHFINRFQAPIKLPRG